MSNENLDLETIIYAEHTKIGTLFGVSNSRETCLVEERFPLTSGDKTQ